MNESDIIRLRHTCWRLLKRSKSLARRRAGFQTNPGRLYRGFLAEIIAIRNRLIHAYADVDLSIVWDTLTGALPELLRELETALAD